MPNEDVQILIPDICEIMIPTVEIGGCRITTMTMKVNCAGSPAITWPHIEIRHNDDVMTAMLVRERVSTTEWRINAVACQSELRGLFGDFNIGNIGFWTMGKASAVESVSSIVWTAMRRFDCFPITSKCSAWLLSNVLSQMQDFGAKTKLPEAGDGISGRSSSDRLLMEKLKEITACFCEYCSSSKMFDEDWNAPAWVASAHANRVNSVWGRRLQKTSWLKIIARVEVGDPISPEVSYSKPTLGFSRIGVDGKEMTLMFSKSKLGFFKLNTTTSRFSKFLDVVPIVTRKTELNELCEVYNTGEASDETVAGFHQAYLEFLINFPMFDRTGVMDRWSESEIQLMLEVEREGLIGLTIYDLFDADPISIQYHEDLYQFSLASSKILAFKPGLLITNRTPNADGAAELRVLLLKKRSAGWFTKSYDALVSAKDYSEFIGYSGEFKIKPAVIIYGEKYYRLGRLIAETSDCVTSKAVLGLLLEKLKKYLSMVTWIDPDGIDTCISTHKPNIEIKQILRLKRTELDTVDYQFKFNAERYSFPGEYYPLEKSAMTITDVVLQRKLRIMISLREKATLSEPRSNAMISRTPKRLASCAFRLFTDVETFMTFFGVHEVLPCDNLVPFKDKDSSGKRLFLFNELLSLVKERIPDGFREDYLRFLCENRWLDYAEFVTDEEFVCATGISVKNSSVIHM